MCLRAKAQLRYGDPAGRCFGSGLRQGGGGRDGRGTHRDSQGRYADDRGHEEVGAVPGTQGSAVHERVCRPSVGHRAGQVPQDYADHRYTSAREAAEAGSSAERQRTGQGESTGFRSATVEPFAGRTGEKQTSGTTPHTGGALGNLNLIGNVRSRKLALSAPAPGYKEVAVQVKEVPIWQKSNLTLEEAAAYSGIGINKLRSMTDSDECKFVLWNGTKRLIKRRKLDEYLDKAFSI